MGLWPAKEQRLVDAFAAVVAGEMDAEGEKVGSPTPAAQMSALPLPHLVEEGSLWPTSWLSGSVDDFARYVEHRGQSESCHD